MLNCEDERMILFVRAGHLASVDEFSMRYYGRSESFCRKVLHAAPHVVQELWVHILASPWLIPITGVWEWIQEQAITVFNRRDENQIPIGAMVDLATAENQLAQQGVREWRTR